MISPVVLLFYIANTGCGTDNNVEGDNNPQVVEPDSVDAILDGGVMNIDGKMFPIPSPFMTTMLIKENNFGYEGEILNAPGNVSNYSTNFQKALNLGIYGADLGYATIFEQSNDALKFFKSVEELASDLGVSSAFDSETTEQIKRNIGYPDSLLNIVSIAYRSADSYLKTNARHDISALVLTGGWVESFNFMVEMAKKQSNQDLKNRIGEQKTPLENVIKILKSYVNDSEEMGLLIEDLVDIAFVFDGVDINYNYVKPTIDVQNKTTIIKSTSDVVISPEQLSMISEKVSALRAKIVNNEIVQN